MVWIKHDFELWANIGGITRDDVIRASQITWGYCAGDVLRFQILDGRLWVDFKTDRSPDGWYPARLGPGNASAKGRVPYIIFALLDTLRAFPGQIPNIDVVIHTGDFPCIKKDPGMVDYPRPREPEDTGRPILMLGYNSGNKYLDIPFPDYTHYGHEHSVLTTPGGQYLLGWDKQRSLLEAKFAAVPFETRLPQVVWRGRTNDDDFPQRDQIRRDFVACPAELASKGRPEDAALFNVNDPYVALSDIGFYRYPMYLESQAYTTNLKQKIACGSPILTPKLEYYEWWSRALEPGEHYVEVAGGADMCSDIAAKVRQMDEVVDGATDPKTQPKAARNQHRLRRRLAQNAANVPLQPKIDPREVGHAGQKFLNQHVRMDDVRTYIKDLLREYARHQTFRAWRSEGSRCMNWKRMLGEYRIPHEKDVEVLLTAYPYLNTTEDYTCEDEDAVPYFWACENMERQPGVPGAAVEGCSGLEMPPPNVMEAYRASKQRR